MRHLTILLAAYSLVVASTAFAQAPGPGATSTQPAPAQPGAPMPGAPMPGAQPGAATPPAAGGVPTSAQQSTVPTQTDQEPARAPGAKGENGQEMPKTGDNSGTTTYFAPAKPEAEVKWPCVQPRVASISAGTIWSGPDVAEGKDWDQDNDLAALAQKIAARRTPIEEIEPAVAEFAKTAGADKPKKLTKLFVGVLEIINGNRNKILQGIMRYAQGQQRLADRMREEADKISQLQDELKGNSQIAAQQKNTEFAWDKRIFQERKQALSYVCETPSMLERRAYQIGKIIQAQL